LLADYRLSDFWNLEPARRQTILLEAISQTHAWHYERNQAYRRAVRARGVGPIVSPADLPRLVRPAAQTFKSYIDLLGTPFPQDRAPAFAEWLAGQLSIDLPRDRLAAFRPRYSSLEALLASVERILGEYGLEVLTSSGTSGRASIVVRDQDGLNHTVESFYLAFQRIMGMRADHHVVLLMPRRTRIAMARMALFSFARVGLTDDQLHCTIPFPAYPDQVRIRAGRTFRSGWQGALERRLWHPGMNWLTDHYVTRRAVREAIAWLHHARASGERVLLFGGLVHLHAVALELRRRGETMELPAGSLVGSGGGLKERYSFSSAQIRADVAQVVRLAGGEPIPIRDVYGMAEANWAAMQCAHGNYHVPPWVYVVTLGDEGIVQAGPDTTGLLAFFDPFGGGRLFPAFFKTADRVRLIGGSACAGGAAGALACGCGEPGAYLAQDSIQRVDLLDEAGCAAQV
jgi:hypothetical protein